MVDTAQAGGRLDAVIAAAVAELSRAQVQRLIEDGHVTVGGVVAGKAMRVREGDAIEVMVPVPEPLEVVAEAIPLVVLFEDADLIVIDKPAGLVVHPAAGHARGTLVNALLHHCKDLSGIGGVLRPGIVHRLDKDTSGVMVATKSERAHAALTAAFAAKSRGAAGGPEMERGGVTPTRGPGMERGEVTPTRGPGTERGGVTPTRGPGTERGGVTPTRGIDRTYLAITSPAPPLKVGTLRTAYGRHPVHRKKFSSKGVSGKLAVTHYEIVEKLPTEAALVRFRLETGRTHQIRVHASEHNFALVGDPVYGHKPRTDLLGEVATKLARQALHAATLAFEHPASGERLSFESPLPDDMQAALAALR